MPMMLYEPSRLTSARAESTCGRATTRPRRAAHLRSRRARPCRNSPRRRAGLISARAESTGRGPRSRGMRPAHLRSRGEHWPRSTSVHFSDGSPPLARRAHRREHRSEHPVRLTSARAESTRKPPSVPTSGAAHLRSRGEHVVSRWEGAAVGGSPSLARRVLHVLRLELGQPRLTSARAESTRRRRRRRWSASAHLRSRGEHALSRAGWARRSGSPPLARRALRHLVQDVRPVRLTSARAESTALGRQPVPHKAAHLRSRGEHPVICVTGQSGLGSPPLARRAPRHGQFVRLPPRLTSARTRRAPRRPPRVRRHHRLTSAHAESTRSLARRAAVSAAHLRSRGEHG